MYIKNFHFVFTSPFLFLPDSLRFSNSVVAMYEINMIDSVTFVLTILFSFSTGKILGIFYVKNKRSIFEDQTSRCV